MLHTSNDNQFNLKWPWYLFLLANIILILGVAINWALLSWHFSPTPIQVINIIFNLISIILLILFYYFDSKDLYLLKQHIPIKYFRLYFIGGFIFLIDVIFVVCYTIFNQSIQTHIGLTNTFVVCMVISIFISLISVIVYRYSKYKMDRIIFLRKRGQNTNPDKQSSNIPEKRSVSTDETLASSGLINHVDKE